jgi:Domain of unknown function (DUF4386)
MSLRTCARIAGVLLLLSAIGGGLGEAYIPMKLIVAGNAAATASNIRAADSLFRFGFAAYLVEGLCDVALAWIFYLLLRPVREDLALLAAFFGLVSTATFAVCELFYLAVSLVLKDAAYLQSFTPDQRNTLAVLLLKAYSLGGGAFMAFYGVASLIRAYLMFRSGYIPRFIGVILSIAGASFVVKTFTLVLAPAYSSDVLLLPMFLALVVMTVWFLVKGVDVALESAARG